MINSSWWRVWQRFSQVFAVKQMKTGASTHDWRVMSSSPQTDSVRRAAQTQRRPQPEDQLKHLRLPQSVNFIPKVKSIPKVLLASGPQRLAWS